MHAFLGRQPIFDRSLNVYAYELLFRSGGGGAANVADGEQAMSQVIINAFTDLARRVRVRIIGAP